MTFNVEMRIAWLDFLATIVLLWPKKLAITIDGGIGDMI